MNRTYNLCFSLTITSENFSLMHDAKVTGMFLYIMYIWMSCSHFPWVTRRFV